LKTLIQSLKNDFFFLLTLKEQTRSVITLN
jgi:hypothetical protein